MSTAELQAPPPVTEFTMPPIEEGEQVRWFNQADPSQHPAKAFVHKVNPQTIEVLLISPNRQNVPLMTCVRHMSDPNLKGHPEKRSNGAWDYAPKPKWRIDLEAAVSVLTSRVAELELAATEPKRKGKAD